MPSGRGYSPPSSHPDRPLENALGNFVLALPMLLAAMVIHEYAHARVALAQGDDTAYLLGRVTLNPIPHIDLWMSILLPVMLWFGSAGRFTFGGAKPVPVNPRKYRNYRKGDILVSAAGVTANFLMALAAALLFVLLGLLGSAAPGMTSALDPVQRMLTWGVWLNILICFFNLIPLPPLDGSHIFYHLLPPALGAKYRSLQRFGFLPLMAILIFLPRVTGFLLTPAFAMLGWLTGLMAPYQLDTGLRIFS